MKNFPEGTALVYCEGAFGTPNGKTAHGLVRRTERYKILGVIDSCRSGLDAGEVLDGRVSGIPIFGSLKEALSRLQTERNPVSHFVIGLAPDGGRLAAKDRTAVREALLKGLHVDSGLHDFLTEDPELVRLAKERGLTIRDVRKPPPRDRLHFFSGKIEEVTSFKLAVLGTDSAVGKRTTAWLLVDAFNALGYRAELIGTGQTAWMQGARYGFILDSCINDFISGEIEHAVWSAWNDTHPDVIVLEGQGSLMNPAYPGGFELLAAGRPDAVVLQHAPGRFEYDGFPGYPIQPIERQIQAVEVISNKPVAALAVNHENLSPEELAEACRDLARRTGLAAVDVLRDGADRLMEVLVPLAQGKKENR
ncbi:MAG: DUF1611 domain-containing protein [Candidatus Aminicenantes bacterium]|nr:DUF1611 domain-containing protein [Candidatus Aminicenantes bacterium]